ncbi:MAG: O-antigen ligase family protein [Acidobacteria bacterium]|nr:O-antigen ligase family protein [Acidobacteriota bacterium]MCL5287197.1 O-antigen ligase family protein [Acidobacteriota bacterium]
MSVAINGAAVAAEQSRAHARSGTKVFLRAGTISVLVAAPLAFGATTTVASVALIAAAWVLLLIWIFEGVRKEELPLNLPAIAPPAALLLLFTTVHWAAGLSVARDATQLEWLRWVGYGALALVAAECFDTPRRLKRLAESLGIAGFLIAVLAIAQYLTANGKIYWLIEPTHGGWVFGPYVNRNHFAGLMELWTPLAIGLALRPENTLARRWMWCIVALVMGSSVLLSGSRGGTIALVVEIVVLALAASAQHGGRKALAAVAIALVVVGGGVWALDQGQALRRFEETFRVNTTLQEEATAHRIGAWKGTWTLFQQHWAIGSGLETFESLFPAARPFASDKIWTHAHNDWLQFLAETGAVGAALGLWILFAGGLQAWRNFKETSGTATGAILMGMAAGCMGLLIHGWLDFNFHVPANAANFAVLAAVLTRRGWDEI